MQMTRAYVSSAADDAPGPATPAQLDAAYRDAAERLHARLGARVPSRMLLLLLYLLLLPRRVVGRDALRELRVCGVLRLSVECYKMSDFVPASKP